MVDRKSFTSLASTIKKNDLDGLSKLLQLSFNSRAVLTTATDDWGKNFILVACESFSSSSQQQPPTTSHHQTAMIRIIFEHVVEVGGRSLLFEQFCITDRFSRENCLMSLCANPSASLEVLKFTLHKIFEIGGQDLLTSLISAKDFLGLNCLMFVCSNASSFTEKIYRVSSANGWDDHMFVKRNPSSAAMMKLFASVLCHLNLFKEQYGALSEGNKNKLKEKAGIDSCYWTPDAESASEVKALLQVRVQKA